MEPEPGPRPVPLAGAKVPESASLIVWGIVLQVFGSALWYIGIRKGLGALFAESGMSEAHGYQYAGQLAILGGFALMLLGIYRVAHNVDETRKAVQILVEQRQP